MLAIARLPQLHRLSAFLKTSQPALTRTIKGIEDLIGLHRGIKTLPIIGPTLSRTQGVVTLKEREPTPAAVGISATIRPVWSTGRIDACQGIINAIMILLL
jgi:hypothetical protein